MIRPWQKIYLAMGDGTSTGGKTLTVGRQRRRIAIFASEKRAKTCVNSWLKCAPREHNATAGGVENRCGALGRSLPELVREQ